MEDDNRKAKTLWSRFKQKPVLVWGLSYPIGAWVLLQLLAYMESHIVGLPDWVIKFTLVSLVLFYFIGLAFTASWQYKPKNVPAGSSESSFYSNRADYYPIYFQLINEATREVWMVGDGFSCHDEENRLRAKGLIDAMTNALNNGCKVQRFQYNTTLSLAWLEMLLKLKSKYDDEFQVYMHQPFDPNVLPYVICLTDVSKGKNCSSNIMFTHSGDTRLKEYQGGAASIVQGKKGKIFVRSIFSSIECFFNDEYFVGRDQLNDMLQRERARRKKQIKTYLNSERSISVDNSTLQTYAKNLGILDVDLVFETVAEVLVERGELYFAFGSNMDQARIQIRCPSAKLLTNGYIDGYEIRFNIRGTKSEGKSGGIANIVPTNSPSGVHGVIYAVNKKDLDKLHKIEKAMGYEVEHLNVVTRDGLLITAAAYIGKGGPDDFPPTKAYRDFIENGMQMNGFPDSYKAQVRRVMSDG